MTSASAGSRAYCGGGIHDPRGLPRISRRFIVYAYYEYMQYAYSLVSLNVRDVSIARVTCDESLHIFLKFKTST